MGWHWCTYTGTLLTVHLEGEIRDRWNYMQSLHLRQRAGLTESSNYGVINTFLCFLKPSFLISLFLTESKNKWILIRKKNCPMYPLFQNLYLPLSCTTLTCSCATLTCSCAAPACSYVHVALASVSIDNIQTRLKVGLYSDCPLMEVLLYMRTNVMHKHW